MLRDGLPSCIKLQTSSAKNRVTTLMSLLLQPSAAKTCRLSKRTSHQNMPTTGRHSLPTKLQSIMQPYCTHKNTSHAVPVLPRAQRPDSTPGSHHGDHMFKALPCQNQPSSARLQAFYSWRSRKTIYFSKCTDQKIQNFTREAPPTHRTHRRKENA